eukprot:916731_1
MVILKEYRILLPFTVQQYQVGQLYLTAKSSQSYSTKGEGIEVVVNEPFENKEYGKGQYTKKIFHLSNLIPAWVRYLFSSLNHLSVIEESWNCYPTCKTIFHCQYFGEQFRIEVDTKHTEGELGKVSNIHNLNQKDLILRKIDYIDIVNDPVPEKKYKKEEDPKLFKSKHKNIGPLTKHWIHKTKPILCAYKLVRVQFDKWLIGSRIEQAIHDYGFREIFLEVNRQSFCWMDEWIWMNMTDIRKYEKECAKKQNEAVSGVYKQPMIKGVNISNETEPKEDGKENFVNN